MLFLRHWPSLMLERSIIVTTVNARCRFRRLQRLAGLRCFRHCSRVTWTSRPCCSHPWWQEIPTHSIRHWYWLLRSPKSLSCISLAGAKSQCQLLKIEKKALGEIGEIQEVPNSYDEDHDFEFHWYSVKSKEQILVMAKKRKSLPTSGSSTIHHSTHHS